MAGLQDLGCASSKWMACPFMDATIPDSLGNMLLGVGDGPDALQWCTQDQTEQAESSARVAGHEEGEMGRSRKRSRGEASGPAEGSKASREKKRRDQLSARFLELSTLLDPGRPPKTDKGSILTEAIKVVGLLQTEAEQLKETNEQLKENIKELKMEKTELRDEKSKLKEEKDKLEQQIKSFSPASLLSFAPASAPYANNPKGSTPPAFPGAGFPMWRWMAPAAVDTSQDQLLRPPAA